jgi:hypothetical protein
MRRAYLIWLMPLVASLPAYADEAELRERIRQLDQEMQELSSRLKEMDQRTEALASQQEEGAGQPGRVSSEPSPPSIWGYGEIHYNRPTHDSGTTRMDLHRAVVGFGYHFDETTRFNSEFEIEHAIASAEDEVEVEQFYVDHQLAPSANIKTGLILVPMGLLNETHEPVYFYGVERNFIETAIIPTTWREGGVGIYGGTARGIGWDVGVTTGFDLGKWDFSDPSAGKKSPLGSIRQELMNARARDLSNYVAIKYSGIPGWSSGASLFTGKVAQGNPAVSLASNARLTLWEAHTRWTPGHIDLSALYARGTISDTAQINAANVGNPTLIPEEFWGWYAQAAYRIPLAKTRGIAPFVRFERFNTGAGYADLPSGPGVAPLPTESVWTYGVSFYLNPRVVYKADYQKFAESGDRIDLGIGLAF